MLATLCSHIILVTSVKSVVYYSVTNAKLLELLELTQELKFNNHSAVCLFRLVSLAPTFLKTTLNVYKCSFYFILRTTNKL